jgi:nucleotide-binding universal stress UspA family protein
MRKILVPVDGSESAQRAVEYVAGLAKHDPIIGIELLNVQFPIISGDIRRFVTQAMIDNYHREEGEAALKPAKRLLDGGGVPYNATILVGHIAETIADYALKHECESIVMGTRGMGPMKNLVLGSVATQVIHAAHVPVTLVK